MIRLAPRISAARIELIRGVALDLEAPTPRVYAVASRDAAERVMHLRASGQPVSEAAVRAVTVEALVAHLVVGWHGVVDEAGAPAPFSVEAWRALTEIDPRLVSYARDELDRFLSGAEQATAEGNASPASANGAPAAG